VDAFTQAIDKDPHYAPPYAELAGTVLTFSQSLGLSASEAAAKAKDSALKALQIDPASAAAHTVLGTIKRDFDWDWAGAAAEFEHAIALDPNSSAAHAGYALLLAIRSQFPAAIKEAKLAHDLDLMDLSVSANLITIYMLARQYDLAIEQCHRILDIEPALLVGHTFCGTAYFYQGQYTKAFDEWRQMTDQSDPIELAAVKKASEANTMFGYRQGYESSFNIWSQGRVFGIPAILRHSTRL
jgi:tetratricopeptide (TPR) repeat protein